MCLCNKISILDCCFAVGLDKNFKCNPIFLVQNNSEFIFDPLKWPRAQMDEDFLKLAKKFTAMRSIVRVPLLDPKYKIAVLASKQVHYFMLSHIGSRNNYAPVNGLHTPPDLFYDRV